jgi:excisionase family DNA binding protein
MRRRNLETLMQEPQEEPLLLTVREVSNLLRLSTATVRRLIDAGHLEAVNVGTRQIPTWRVSRQNLASFLKRRVTTQITP